MYDLSLRSDSQARISDRADRAGKPAMIGARASCRVPECLCAK